MDGIAFIARLGSTRLHHKHLIKVNGKTFIEWLIVRFISRFESELNAGNIKLVLLTADEAENREFENVLQEYPVEVFYGSVDNIPLRLLQCCDAYNFDHLISVDGDDILCSADGARQILEKISSSKIPTIAKTVGLPLGMNVMAITRSLLSDKRSKIGTGRLETGWGWVFEGAEVIEVRKGSYDANGKLRFTLDYEEDAAFFSKVIEGIDVINIGDEDLIDYVLSHEINQLNQHLNNEYWANFTKQQSSEKE